MTSTVAMPIPYVPVPASERFLSRAACLTLIFSLSLGLSGLASAQVVDPTPGQRQLRTYIPPDQLVSFSAATPFNQFVEFVNPLFQRLTGKAVVDLTERSQPIGINISGLQFIDAFELVLERAGLMYRETDRYFLIETPSQVAPLAGPQTVAAPAATGRAGIAVTAEDREIQIDAIIFEVNLDRFREAGTNWSTIFGEGTGSGGGTGTGDQLRFFLNTERAADRISDVVIMPNRVDFREIVSLFRYFETIGVGETVANPSIVVRSGQEGRIQSGSDIPVTLRDFAGNTVTQYIPTGVIITARPVLIVDDTDPDVDPVEFIQLIINVERSAGRLGATGIIIDKNQATTEVLLLDGEQTAIGGLYSTEESISRRGVPILMDIPLLKYLFSYNTRSIIERELVIVLQTRLLDPLRTRARRPLPGDAIDESLRDTQRQLNRALPEPPRPIRRPDVRRQ
jgi:hypothetical protein